MLFFILFCNKSENFSYNCIMTELRTYHDSINEVIIKFRSDAPQSTIDALEFNGEWYIVREILCDWGYIVIEYPNRN